MTQARCKNGHIYDSEIYGSVCPYCDHTGNTINFNEDGEYHFKSVAKEKITPQEQIGKTAPPPGYMEKQEELKKTTSVFSKEKGNDPVVAWIVCINGSEKGKDYRLIPKTNTIGRSSENDIWIKGDDTITRNAHAKIDYDVLNNNFYLLPANNDNTIYVNNAPLYSPQMLKPYDVLRFGQSEFSFVPFCSDKFTWSK